MANSAGTPDTGFTQEEIEKFRKVFRTMSTYNESISSKELVQYLQAINYIKPMKTYQQYIDHADRLLGGRFEMTQIMKYISTGHDSRRLFNIYLKDIDLDNDGFISPEEFAFAMKTLQLNDPKLGNISYDQFLKEADTNKDGRISVAECQAWVKKTFGV